MSNLKIRRMLWVVLVVPTILLGTPIVDFLMERKESQFPVVNVAAWDTTARYLIVVLGAGKTSDPKLYPTQQLNRTTAVRLLEGYRLYRALPKARLALSGASFDSDTPQAKVTAEAALQLGVAAQDTIQLRSTVHTQSEVEAIAERIVPGEQLVVVSSAVHLPRAHFWLRKYKLSARMAPAHFWIKRDPSQSKSPWNSSPGRRLSMWHSWWHETLGTWHARWLE
jgi:uncharacterized SAM-binding protein YcdF (DUF218 family)